VGTVNDWQEIASKKSRIKYGWLKGKSVYNILSPLNYLFGIYFPKLFTHATPGSKWVVAIGNKANETSQPD